MSGFVGSAYATSHVYPPPERLIVRSALPSALSIWSYIEGRLAASAEHNDVDAQPSSVHVNVAGTRPYQAVNKSDVR